MIELITNTLKKIISQGGLLGSLLVIMMFALAWLFRALKKEQERTNQYLKDQNDNHLESIEKHTKESVRLSGEALDKQDNIIDNQDELFKEIKE